MNTEDNSYLVQTVTMGNQVNYNTTHYTYIPDRIPVVLGPQGNYHSIRLKVPLVQTLVLVVLC